MGNKQLHLFVEKGHYDQDCFLSGDPAIPDPLECPVEYETWKDRRQAALFHGELAYNGNSTLGKKAVEAVLCDPVEDGWRIV